MENLNLFIFLIFTSDVFSFHLFCRITLPLHFCEAIEICPSAAVSIVPLSWFQEDTSISPLCWRAQNWTQYSRCGLTSAEERGRITSLSLLITLWMQPGRLLAPQLWPVKHCFLLFLLLSASLLRVHQNIVPSSRSLVKISNSIWPQDWPLGYTLEDQPLAGLHATDHDALSPAVLPHKSISLSRHLNHTPLVCQWDCYGRQWWKPC